MLRTYDLELLQSRVFRSPGMRESRPGVGVASRRAHMRLRASRRPPPICISLGLAHLHAAAAQVRFCTAAITASCRDTVQQRGRIGQQRQGAGEQANLCAEQLNVRPAAPGCSIAETWHAPFCAGFQRKTDSAECSGVLLPGFWNWIRPRP